MINKLYQNIEPKFANVSLALTLFALPVVSSEFIEEYSIKVVKYLLLKMLQAK